MQAESLFLSGTAILRYSPPLADVVAIRTDNLSVDQIALKILEVIRPDLYASAMRPRVDMTNAIASDLGITDLPRDEQEQLIAQFGEIALKAATLSVMERLSESKRDEFAALAESGNAKAVKTFLDREVPDHEAISKTAVAEEVRKFKAFLAG